MSQTIARSLCEIILVVSPDFSPRENLSALAGSAARLEFTDSAHDTSLCAIGAAWARRKYLFFTEIALRARSQMCARSVSKSATTDSRKRRPRCIRPTSIPA